MFPKQVVAGRGRSLIPEPNFSDLTICPSVDNREGPITTENDDWPRGENFLFTINVLVFPRFLAPNHWNGAVCFVQNNNSPTGLCFVSQDKLRAGVSSTLRGQR